MERQDNKGHFVVLFFSCVLLCVYRTFWWRPGCLRTQWSKHSLCSAPPGAAVTVWDLVSRRFKSEGSRTAANAWWRLPGARVGDHARTVCADGAAGRSAQTPAPCWSRRSGELVWGDVTDGREMHTVCVCDFLNSIFFFRFVLKIIDLKVWVISLATTWTTGSPSYQQAVKFAWNSQ